MTKKCLLLCFAMQCIQGMETNVLQKNSTNSWNIVYKKQEIGLYELSLDNFTIYQELDIISCFIVHSYHEKEHPMSNNFYSHPLPKNKSICSYFDYYKEEFAQEIDNHLYDQRQHLIIKKKEQLLSNKNVKKSSKKLTKLYKNILDENLLEIPYYSSPKLLGPSVLNINLRFSETKLTLSAIQTIFKLIRKKPDIYGTINFIANNPTDFAWHKTVLFQQMGLLHNICLFYWIHKNHDILSQLPKEIRDYIVKLI